jgi:hypothetical protein
MGNFDCLGLACYGPDGVVVVTSQIKGYSATEVSHLVGEVSHYLELYLLHDVCVPQVEQTMWLNTSVCNYFGLYCPQGVSCVVYLRFLSPTPLSSSNWEWKCEHSLWPVSDFDWDGIGHGEGGVV